MAFLFAVGEGVSRAARLPALDRIEEIHLRRGRVGDLDALCRRLLIAAARKEGRIGAALPAADLIEPLHLVATRHLTQSGVVRDLALLSVMIVAATAFVGMTGL
ncbi:hypothetical protein HDIA_1392 [Hartmannibacter diazotrophicus]|uniref:Uncharacterized protein n=1 Tax=Hartmannibacter diazotrophicus TaxID=1482074 RepID=A0A2C9D3X9_9HYPH|nr:hypothetical protein [Hartmannibacter diazotrophicus]SON54933.1 hypothetical protein HDIA_1392 [Hartmannibacter diazotrophicus]